MCDKTAGTLQLWTVNAVFTPGSFFVLEEATFIRVHSCKLSSWLDICMSEIVSGVRAQILHLWLIWEAQILTVKTLAEKEKP